MVLYCEYFCGCLFLLVEESKVYSDFRLLGKVLLVWKRVLVFFLFEEFIFVIDELLKRNLCRIYVKILKGGKK